MLCVALPPAATSPRLQLDIGVGRVLEHSLLALVRGQHIIHIHHLVLVTVKQSVPLLDPVSLVKAERVAQHGGHGLGTGGRRSLCSQMRRHLTILHYHRPIVDSFTLKF